MAEVLGPDFIGRGRSSGKDSALFNPSDTVSYEKLNYGQDDEVHLGLDLSGDAVSSLICIVILCTVHIVEFFFLAVKAVHTLCRLDTFALVVHGILQIRVGKIAPKIAPPLMLLKFWQRYSLVKCKFACLIVRT